MILGSVRIEHDLGPVAHSDGDALLHAITDALLGAIGEPDIGQVFPDTDPAHHARDSADFLAEALARVARVGRVLSVDATVVLQRPKIGPLREQIRARLATLLGLDLDRVNVKGKTHEGIGALGQARAVEVHAVALVLRRSNEQH